MPLLMRLVYAIELGALDDKCIGAVGTLVALVGVLCAVDILCDKEVKADALVVGACVVIELCALEVKAVGKVGTPVALADVLCAVVMLCDKGVEADALGVSACVTVALCAVNGEANGMVDKSVAPVGIFCAVVELEVQGFISRASGAWASVVAPLRAAGVRFACLVCTVFLLFVSGREVRVTNDLWDAVGIVSALVVEGTVALVDGIVDFFSGSAAPAGHHLHRGGQAPAGHHLAVIGQLQKRCRQPPRPPACGRQVGARGQPPISGVSDHWSLSVLLVPECGRLVGEKHTFDPQTAL